MLVLKLKEFRRKVRLTQADVSNALNVSQSYYSRLEKGKSLPDANQILIMSKLFKCTPNDLYGIQGEYIVAMEQLD